MMTRSVAVKCSEEIYRREAEGQANFQGVSWLGVANKIVNPHSLARRYARHSVKRIELAVRSKLWLTFVHRAQNTCEGLPEGTYDFAGSQLPLGLSDPSHDSPQDPPNVHHTQLGSPTAHSRAASFLKYSCS